MKNHWNATARRKDAPVQNKDGTSVVLREHLLRTKCGDPNLEVVQVTVGGHCLRILWSTLFPIPDTMEYKYRAYTFPIPDIHAAHTRLTLSCTRASWETSAGARWRLRYRAERASSAASGGTTTCGLT